MAQNESADVSASELAVVLARLHSPRARERAAAAKRLRRIGDPRPGEALLEALHREVPDLIPPEPTWEVQYQLVMALGECDAKEAVPFLRDLAQRDFTATSVYVSLGDALLRLSRAQPSDAEPLLWCARVGQPMLLDGAFRAVAMLRICFDDDTAARLLALPGLTSATEPVGTNRFWPAAAAAGWRGPAVREFLESCITSERADVRDAATSSLAHKYRKWNPL